MSYFLVYDSIYTNLIKGNAMKKAWSLTAAIVILSGCATTNHSDLDMGDSMGLDPVEVSLMKSANSIDESLKKLALVKQAETYGSRTTKGRVINQVSDPALKRTVTIAPSTMDAESVARKIAGNIGYSFVLNGRKPNSPLLITMQADHETVIRVLEKIGLMSGSRADVVIDETHKSIEFRYAN
jgi:hypothetical protein